MIPGSIRTVAQLLWVTPWVPVALASRSQPSISCNAPADATRSAPCALTSVRVLPSSSNGGNGQAGSLNRTRPSGATDFQSRFFICAQGQPGRPGWLKADLPQVSRLLSRIDHTSPGAFQVHIASGALGNGLLRCTAACLAD